MIFIHDCTKFSALIAASFALAACTTVSNPAELQPQHKTNSASDPTRTLSATSAMKPDRHMVDLPLVMLDRIEQQTAFAVDENIMTTDTPEEVAAEAEGVRIEQETYARHLATKAAGLCKVPFKDMPDDCFYAKAVWQYNSMEIPRYAAPFQVQFLWNEKGSTSENLKRAYTGQPEWEARHVCGGSLIAPGWAISAAHCFAIAANKERTKYVVREDAYSLRIDVENIASDQPKQIAVQKIIMHPEYNLSNSSNDLALVQFEADAMKLNNMAPWFEGTSVAKDNHINSAYLTPQGIEISYRNNQNIQLNPKTRRLTQNPSNPLGRRTGIDRYTIEYESPGGFSVKDNTKGTLSKIGQNTVWYNRRGVSQNGKFAVFIIQESHSEKAVGEIWNVAKNQRIAAFDSHSDYSNGSIHFSPNSKKFHLWTAAGESQIRKTKTGGLLQTINHSLPVHSAKYGPKGLIVIEGLFGSVELLDIDDETVPFRAFHGGGKVHTDWDDKQLLTWSKDGRVRLFDLGTGLEKLYYIHNANAPFQPTTATVPDDPVRVQKVRLAPAEADPNPALYRDNRLTTYGWGRTHYKNEKIVSAVLRTVALSPITWDQCNQLEDTRKAGIAAKSKTLALPLSKADPSAFCALGAGRKTCRGDSGGPVLLGAHLVGIVSRGSGGCWTDDAPTIFTSVPKATAWIQSVICKPTLGDGQAARLPELCP